MALLRLSEKERNVIAVVELQAKLGIAEIAKRTGYRPSTVQYTLKKARERGIITDRRPMIDLNRLGYTHYTIYVALSSEREKLFEQLDTLRSSPEITWLFEIAGRFQYGISITVRHVAAVVAFLDKLSKLFGDNLIERKICTQGYFEYYGRKYLLTKRLKTPRLSFEFNDNALEIDAIDRDILRAMSSAEDRTLQELALRTSIPLATLDRRRKNLEARGIIHSYFHWVNSHALGRICYIFRITCRGAPAGLRKRVFDYAAQERDVIYAIACIGPWDYELGVELEGGTAVIELTQRVCAAFKKEVLSVEPVPVLRYLLIRNFPET